MKVQDVIRELSLDNRLTIIFYLLQGEKSISEVRRNLKIHGINKPYITVSRYLEALRRAGLVTRKKGIYSLTSLGYLAAGFVKKFEDNIQILEKYADYFSEHIIPVDFDLRVLEFAELKRNAISMSLSIADALRSCRNALISLPEFDNSIAELTQNADIQVVHGRNVKIGVIVIDSNKAWVFFPNNSGSVDITSAFYGEHAIFVKEAERVFHFQRESFPLFEQPLYPQSPLQTQE